MSHPYLEKIKNNKDITKHEKLDYINSLIFDSNKIMLNKNNFNKNQFLEDFNSIISEQENLYVYLDFQDCNCEKKLSDKDYKDIYQQSIENIDNIFGKERIILQSSKLDFIKNDKDLFNSNSIKCFLIYSDNVSNTYLENQKNILNKMLSLNSYAPWDFKNLLSIVHQMQLYKVLYKDLFIKISGDKISNFTEDSNRDKIHSTGIIKKTPTKYKNKGEKYTLFNFNIKPDFKNFKENLTYTFSIVTKVYIVEENSKVLSTIRTYNHQTTQMAVLSDVKSLRNFYDKKSITFNVNDFDDSKFHFYCLTVDILKRNKFTSISQSSLIKTYPVNENESFYKNNITKPLNIGIVFEEHLKNKIKEYVHYLTIMLDEKSKWATSQKIILIEIEIAQNLDEISLINTLKKSDCDCFICLTDIKINDDENDDEIGNNEEEFNDYYRTIKNYILKQNLENKETLITQGIYVPKPITDDDSETEKDHFSDKIKTTFFEICTKYIFYKNNIVINTDLIENDYLLISFAIENENKLCSCIKIHTKDNNINIVDKRLIKINSTSGSGFKKDNDLINFLTPNIFNVKHILEKITSYDEFIVYDLKNQTFLIISHENTYLLSDNEYRERKEIIKTARNGNTYVNKKGVIKDSLCFMSPLLPLYNVSKTMDSQIFLFELNNEKYYFIGNENKKTLEHPQSPLVKITSNVNNSDLFNLYFSLITDNVVRNGLNTKTTLFEKFSKLYIKN